VRAPRRVRGWYFEVKMGIKTRSQKEKSTRPKSRALRKSDRLRTGCPARKESYCNGALAFVGAVPSVV